MGCASSQEVDASTVGAAQSEHACSERRQRRLRERSKTAGSDKYRHKAVATQAQMLRQAENDRREYAAKRDREDMEALGKMADAFGRSAPIPVARSPQFSEGPDSKRASVSFASPSGLDMSRPASVFELLNSDEDEEEDEASDHMIVVSELCNGDGIPRASDGVDEEGTSLPGSLMPPPAAPYQSFEGASCSFSGRSSCTSTSGRRTPLDTLRGKLEPIALFRPDGVARANGNRSGFVDSDDE